MKILALEFSSPQRSVAVVESIGDERSTMGDTSSPGAQGPPALSEVVETGSLGANAIGMIDAALGRAQAEREQIECLAVGLGPGSYHGIRLAIAVAQGWQLARQERVRLLGISSAECIASQACADHLVGRVNVIIDAQRSEFYAATYDIAPEGWSEIQPLQITTEEDLLRRQKLGESLIGPGVSSRFDKGRLVFPRAATLGHLAIGRTDFVPAEKLDPIYLRKTNFVKTLPARILPG